MKPTNQLTELSIKQAKPKEKQYKLTDAFSWGTTTRKSLPVFNRV